MTGVPFLPLHLAFLMLGAAEGRPLAVELPRGGASALAAPVDPLPGLFPGHVAGLRSPEREPAAIPVGVRAALPAVSSRFGRRADPIRGSRRMHEGIDIPGRRGTRVVASEAGLVRFAGEAGGYGRMVEIAHGHGLATRYAHLDRILVRPGAQVLRGQPIGLMGATGRATGPHVHFEIRDRGRAVDPLGRLGNVAPLRATASTVPTAEVPHRSSFARARAAACRDGGSGS